MIISLLQEKGGVGKTTLAINLSALLQDKGHSVLLVDSDPQGSARDWHAVNEGEVLDVIGLDRPTIDKDIKQFQKQYDYILVDGAPRFCSTSTKIIMFSDIVLIPIMPSPYDVWASQTLVELIKQRQDITGGLPKAAFVISRQVSNTKIGKEVRDVIKDYGLPVLMNGTFSRTVYPETAGKGLTVLNLNKGNPATTEIMNLVDEIINFSNQVLLEEV
jgi:chromosome partitioning protein